MTSIFNPDGTLDPKVYKEFIDNAIIKDAKMKKINRPWDPIPIYNQVQKEGIHYPILWGSRGLGKSTQLAAILLRKVYETGKQFYYIRRYKDDTSPVLVEGWVRNLDISYITDGTYNRYIAYRSMIYFAKEENGKIIDKKQIGWYGAVNTSQKMKSQQYPLVRDNVFEEMVPEDKPWLYDEPKQVASFVSTITRDRDIPTWMIGNTTTKLCPYIKDWKLTGMPKMKPGDMDYYESKCIIKDEEGEIEHVVKYLVENCKARGIFSGSAAGAGAEQLYKNSFSFREQPTVRAGFVENCDVLYTIYMVHQNLIFKMQFLRASETEYFWYVKPASNKITLADLDAERVITDEVDFNPLHSGLMPISQKEKRVFSYFTSHKVFFSDFETGTDWKDCYKALLQKR